MSPRELTLPRANLPGCYQSLPYLERGDIAPSSLQYKGREIHTPAPCSHPVLPAGRLCTKILAKFTARGHRHPRAGDLGLQCASFAWQTSSPCNSPYFTHHGRLSIRCKIRPGVLVHIYDVHMGGMKVRNPILSLTVCTSGLRQAWAVRDPSEKIDR